MRPEVKGETLAWHSNSKLSLLVIVVKAIKTKTFRKTPEKLPGKHQKIHRLLKTQ